jgi:hypothetical protein
MQTGSAGYNAVSDAFSIGDAVCPVQDAIKVSVKNSRSITDDQQSNLVIVRKERKKTEIKKQFGKMAGSLLSLEILATIRLFLI